MEVAYQVSYVIINIVSTTIQCNKYVMLYYYMDENVGIYNYCPC